MFLGQGPAAGDVPRPYAAVRSAAGVWGALVSLDPGAVVACSDIGLAVDAAGNAYAAWSVSDGRVRTLDAARRRRLQRRADDRGDGSHSARWRPPRPAAACCSAGSTWPCRPHRR